MTASDTRHWGSGEEALDKYRAQNSPRGLKSRHCLAKPKIARHLGKCGRRRLALPGKATFGGIRFSVIYNLLRLQLVPSSPHNVQTGHFRPATTNAKPEWCSVDRYPASCKMDLPICLKSSQMPDWSTIILCISLPAFPGANVRCWREFSNDVVLNTRKILELLNARSTSLKLLDWYQSRYMKRSQRSGWNWCSFI